jgi:hypothetical protein
MERGSRRHRKPLRPSQAWDEPFKVLDRIAAKNRDKDPERVQRDVAAAIAEVRAATRAKARKRA